MKTSNLKRLADGTLELSITIPWSKVKIAYENALSDFAKNIEVKGFRKGKAPKQIVVQKLGKQTIYQQALKVLLPEAYLEAVKEQKIRPLVNPQIKSILTPENKDWQFLALTCEPPKVSLGNYKGEVKRAFASEKIWVPGKSEDKNKNTKENKEDRINKIFDILLEVCKLQVPGMMIQDEVNRMLTRLVDQTSKLGLTTDQYLTSSGKTSQQLKEEYQKQAEKYLELEFILTSIADEEKIEIPDSEVQKMIEATPDEQIRKSLDTPEQKAYIRHLLRKTRIIDNLAAL